MKNNIIFVGGIHGVGKTTICKSLSTEFNLIHSSASELISKYKKESFSKDKATKNIGENQDHLILAIDEYLDKNFQHVIDGHFCLLDENYNINKIPEMVYKEISPLAIITLFDDVDNIYKRLTQRDNKAFDKLLLSDFQNLELAYSKKIAMTSNIPYLEANPFVEKDNIINFIKRSLSKQE